MRYYAIVRYGCNAANQQMWEREVVGGVYASSRKYALNKAWKQAAAGRFTVYPGQRLDVSVKKADRAKAADTEALKKRYS